MATSPCRTCGFLGVFSYCSPTRPEGPCAEHGHDKHGRSSPSPSPSPQTPRRPPPAGDGLHEEGNGQAFVEPFEPAAIAGSPDSPLSVRPASTVRRTVEPCAASWATTSLSRRCRRCRQVRVRPATRGHLHHPRQLSPSRKWDTPKGTSEPLKRSTEEAGTNALQRGRHGEETTGNHAADRPTGYPTTCIISSSGRPATSRSVLPQHGQDECVARVGS